MNGRRSELGEIDVGPEVTLGAGDATLGGNLGALEDARGLVLFAHGSGSSRFSPRNRFVARVLQNAGLATLLFDLLTPGEEETDARTREYRFDIPLLTQRLVGATDWLDEHPGAGALPFGYFGSSTGAAAALRAAAHRPPRIGAVVTRGGRPDLAEDDLPRVRAPTLLIVGGRDAPVIEMNRSAMAAMTAETRLEIVPGATHLFQEPGALERVAELAADWFVEKLTAAAVPEPG